MEEGNGNGSDILETLDTDEELFAVKIGSAILFCCLLLSDPWTNFQKEALNGSGKVKPSLIAAAKRCPISLNFSITHFL